MGDVLVKSARLVLLAIPLFQGVAVALCKRLSNWRP